MVQKILIIDDEKTVCTGLSKQLQQEGFDVKWELTGKDALELAESDDFDLIVVDLMLPDISGIEFCKSVRKIREKIKLIVMSGYIGVFEEKKTEFDQIDPEIQFIYKPFEKNELLSLIEKS